MRENPGQDVLDVLACEIGKRPVEAPTMEQVGAFVSGSERSGDALIVRFNAGALDAVEAFVAAERQCCPGLTWDVHPGDEVTLRIGGTPAQIDVLAQLFAQR